MAWTSPKTWNVGDVLTAADMNTYVRDNLLSTHNLTKHARVHSSGAQSIASAAATALSFNTMDLDTDTMYNAGSPTRLTCKTAGDYDVYASVQFLANGVGYRWIELRLNGTTVIAITYVPQTASASDDATLTIRRTLALAVNDYVEVLAWQNSGGALNVVGTDSGSQFQTICVGTT